MGATKIDQLRSVILMLTDGAHKARVTDLLNALEQDVGAATLSYAAEIVQVCAEGVTHSTALINEYARDELQRAARSVRLTEWERDDVIGKD